MMLQVKRVEKESVKGFAASTATIGASAEAQSVKADVLKHSYKQSVNRP